MLIFLKQTDNNISDDIMKFLSYCVTFFVLYLHFVKGEISEGDKELIRKWMPIYWLHSEEVRVRKNYIKHKNVYISKVKFS